MTQATQTANFISFIINEKPEKNLLKVHSQKAFINLDAALCHSGTKATVTIVYHAYLFVVF